MPPKRSAPSKASGDEPKRQKKFKTLQEKVELLDLLQELKSYAAVARHYSINESTVRYIKKNEAAIRSAVSVSFCNSAKKVTTIRNKNIVRMESALALWITDCRKINIPLDGNIIRETARKLYQQFATGDDAESTKEPQPGPSIALEPEDFQASKGWFDRFQKRFNIKSISLHREAASANKEDMEKYPETFSHIIEEKGYNPEQVFNMDETGLFWKKMPYRTYIVKDEAKAPRFKVHKDRVSKGFDDITQDEVNNLIDAHSEPLIDKDLLELTKSANKEEEEVTDPEQEDEKEPGLTLERLSQIIRTTRELQEMIEAWDPYMIRALKVNNGINAAIQTYKTLLTTIKKRQQLPITMFCKPIKNSQHETPPKEDPLEDTTPSEVLEEVVPPKEL